MSTSFFILPTHSSLVKCKWTSLFNLGICEQQTVCIVQAASKIAARKRPRNDITAGDSPYYRAMVFVLAGTTLFLSHLDTHTIPMVRSTDRKDCLRIVTEVYECQNGTKIKRSR